ncbi:MAG: hypothetical protein LBK25_05245 [Treponema sp.]|nr:hypothetical protein [Treponema sp.]
MSDTKAKAELVERAAEWVFGSLYHRLLRPTSLVDAASLDDPPLVGQV